MNKVVENLENKSENQNTEPLNIKIKFLDQSELDYSTPWSSFLQENSQYWDANQEISQLSYIYWIRI